MEDFNSFACKLILTAELKRVQQQVFEGVIILPLLTEVRILVLLPVYVELYHSQFTTVFLIWARWIPQDSRKTNFIPFQCHRSYETYLMIVHTVLL